MKQKVTVVVKTNGKLCGVNCSFLRDHYGGLRDHCDGSSMYSTCDLFLEDGMHVVLKRIKKELDLPHILPAHHKRCAGCKKHAY